MFSWRRCALFRREVRDLRAYIHTTELILMRNYRAPKPLTIYVKCTRRANLGRVTAIRHRPDL